MSTVTLRMLYSSCRALVQFYRVNNFKSLKSQTCTTVPHRCEAWAGDSRGWRPLGAPPPGTPEGGVVGSRGSITPTCTVWHIWLKPQWNGAKQVRAADQI